ncbi:MAG: NUDIX hydrolase [Oligoflexus sp.]|jgi:ADP-ribose pyrophosphatase
MDWKVDKIKRLVHTPPFSIEEVQLCEIDGGKPLHYPYYRIVAPSWVNVLALTPEKHAILVRQPRVGIMQMTLEVPGGNMDEGEDPQTAALRELEEETGYRAGQIKSLGQISPNPAIMSNRLHMFLATDCRIPQQRAHFPDTSERIEVVTMPLSELEQHLQSGHFHNALGALTVLMALRFALST